VKRSEENLKSTNRPTKQSSRSLIAPADFCRSAALMKLYDIKDESGRIFAFEVANFGRHRACRFVGKIPGVAVLRRQRHFQFSSKDEFCEFELEGQRFVVEEPWGDNSRYWVGPKPPQWCPQIERVRNAFAAYKAFWLF
jgi:hypothetical protein